MSYGPGAGYTERKITGLASPSLQVRDGPLCGPERDHTVSPPRWLRVRPGDGRGPLGHTLSATPQLYFKHLTISLVSLWPQRL